MASSRNNKNKTSGLRILWIPGGKKGNPKGRFDSTNKPISYNTGQKKSEVWSLGGSRAQKSLLEAESDTSLLDGPSISGLASVTGTVAAISAVKVANANSNTTNTNNANVVAEIISTPTATPTPTSTTTPTSTSTQDTTFVYTTVDASSGNSSHTPITPNTPDSEASTALIASSPNTLNLLIEQEQQQQQQIEEAAQTITIDTNTNTNTNTNAIVDLNKIAYIESSTVKQEEQKVKDTIEEDKENTLRVVYKMPKKTMAPIVKTKATTEIIDENRFAILGDKLKIDEIDIYDLPAVPKSDTSEGENSALNTSSGTTASRTNTPSPSISPGSHKSFANTPIKKKIHPKHQNNSQVDVNSIESISESKQKIPDCDMDWIDELYAESDATDKAKKERCDVGSGSVAAGDDAVAFVALKPKVTAVQKKKKKNRATAKELDQLDGLTGKTHTNGNAKKDEKEDDDDDDDDDVVVKCLYYTLMCCDCTIS